MKNLTKIFVISAIFLFISIFGINSKAIAAFADNATTIRVIETEMAIELSPATAPAGAIKFVADNQGQLPHEMEIIKTDLPLDQLPIKDNRLDRKKIGEKIAEIEAEDLPSGATQSLVVNLTPGKYLIECNIPGHFPAGMKAELIVK